MSARLGVGLLLVLCASACQKAPEVDPVQAPGAQPGVDVQRVEARIVLDTEALLSRCQRALTVAHPPALRFVTLGLDDALEVQSVTRRRRGASIPRGRATPSSFRSRPAVRVSRVAIRYSGTPAAGLYAADAAGQRVVFTDGWPDRTAGWLPTVHVPADPFALDLTLVVPESLQVAASGETVLDTVAAGLRTVRSVLPEGSPAYTAAFAVADFVFATDDSGTVPVRHALLRADADRASAFDRIPAALDTLSARLGPYPYRTFTTVEVPLDYLGMENAASPFLRAALYRAPARGPGSLEETTIHELVHQWWGNRVPPADWRDLWLAEGPATYLTADLLGRLDGGDDGMRHLALVVRNTSLRDAQTRLVPQALAVPEDALDLAVYTKGSTVLHVLRLTVGDRAFWQALRAMQTAGTPVSTADFQAAFERASGQNLDALFRYWTRGTDVPTLTTTWDRGGAAPLVDAHGRRRHAPGRPAPTPPAPGRRRAPRARLDGPRDDARHVAPRRLARRRLSRRGLTRIAGARIAGAHRERLAGGRRGTSSPVRPQHAVALPSAVPCAPRWLANGTML